MSKQFVKCANVFEVEVVVVWLMFMNNEEWLKFEYGIKQERGFSQYDVKVKGYLPRVKKGTIAGRMAKSIGK